MADIENKLVDRRVAQRYVRKGKLDEKDYDKYLKGLPDLADQAVPIEASIEGEDFDDDELEEDEGEAGAPPTTTPPPAQP